MRWVWARKDFVIWQKFLRPKSTFPESKKLFPPMNHGQVMLDLLKSQIRVNYWLSHEHIKLKYCQKAVF